VLSYLWDLPFGKGRRYLASGPLMRVLGNWQLSGITVFQSGRPIVITGPDQTNLFNFIYTNGRTNRVKKPVLLEGQRSLDRVFETTAFERAAPFTVPNDSLTQPNLRGYGRRNFDVSFIKNNPLKERYNVQFRMECFNLFNTPAFEIQGASTEVTSPQFGRVLLAGGQRNIQLGLRVTF